MALKHRLSHLIFGLLVVTGTAAATLIAQPSALIGPHAPALHGAINPQPLPPGEHS